jgi:FMN phosphatase YigB (HAD superfamily)
LSGPVIKAILFDLGNVLVDFDHRIAAKRIAKYTAHSPQEIYSLFFDSTLTAEFEAGKITPAHFFAGVKEMLQAELSYEEFLPIWNEIFFLSPKNRAVYALAEELKKNYRLAMISNINVLHYEYLRARYPVFGVFDQLVTSFEAGAQKPDPKIYRCALTALGISAQEAFYTDDRQELVEKAKEQGIRSAVFTGVGQLRADLRAQGIILQDN